MGNNKALLVGIAGAAITSAVGLGPAAGFAIGTIVGQQIFPPKGPNTEGPRLGDLAVSSATYGAPIPVNFGTIRTNGNIIWSSGIREQKNKDKQGGKGGSSPTSTTTTYSYFASFALALGKGPAVDVLRIWADGKLIYDRLTSQGIDPSRRFNVVDGVVTPVVTASSVYTRAQDDNLFFTFYPGSSTQLPDPMIQAVEGVANTPAFRNLCYIVFDNLPLQNYGNRIPNITAEVTYGGASETATIPVTELPGSVLEGTWDTASLAIDLDRGFAYMKHSDLMLATSGMRKFDLTTMTEIQQTLAEDMGDGVNFPVKVGGPFVVTPSGEIFTQASGGNAQAIYLIDPDSLRVSSINGVNSSSFGFTPITFQTMNEAVVISGFTLTGRFDAILATSSTSSIGIWGLPQLEIQMSTDRYSSVIPGVFTFLGGLPEASVRGVCPAAIGDGFAQGYFLAGSSFISSSSDNVNFYTAVTAPGAQFTVIGTLTANLISSFVLLRSLTVAEIFPGETTLDNVGNMVLDEVDNNPVFWIKRGTSPNDNHIIKIDQDTGDILWRSPPLTTFPPTQRAHSNNTLKGSIYGFVFQDIGYEIDLRDGSIIRGPLTFAGAASSLSGAGYYDSTTRQFFGVQTLGNGVPFRRYIFERNPGGLAFMDETVTAIAGLATLQPSDLDVTEVEDLFVQGYAISRQMSGRAALEPLNNLLYMDGIESDFVLKWLVRGRSVVRSIPFSDLIVVNDRSREVLRQNVTQEIELPRRYTITFLDAETDHQQGSQTAQRALVPLPTMRSENNLGLQFGGSIPSALAKQQAEKGLYTSWSERTSLSGRYPWKHIELDPTDVVNITSRNGDVIRTRLIDNSIGDNLQINFAGIQESLQLFESTVEGNKGAGFVNDLIARAQFIRTVILDVPLLRDGDEPPSRAFAPIYVFMGTQEPGGFIRGTLLDSPDNTEYAIVTSIVSEMDWGVTVSALGDPPDNNPFITDTVNSLQVRMTNGGSALETITTSQLLAGVNAMAIVKANGEVEVVFFQTVTVELDGSYSLTNLLRGRRGTDTMAFSHTAGERIVMLIAVDAGTFTIPVGSLNTAKFYKALGPSQFIEEAFEFSFTSTGRPLKPYAPVQASATAGASDSIDFAWTRRSRLGQAGSLPLPLAEDTEEYRLRIKDGPGGAVVRTVSSLSTAAHNYTSAEQTTDGFTPPLSSITIEVDQVSAQVGNGFSREVTLDVR